MKDDPVPRTDHVSRYCGFAQLSNDGRPSQTAFYLRDGEDFVSVNWLEYFRLRVREDQLDEVRKALTANRLKLRTNGRFAVLNVGDVISFVLSEAKQEITVSHQPDLPNDPSHSGIFYPVTERAFMEYLATQVAERVVEVHNATKSA